MALVGPGSICQICDKELGDAYNSNNVVGLPEGILILTEFHKFNDAVIHQSCFQTWGKAEEFVSLMNMKLREAGYKEAIITNEGKLEYV